MDLFYPSIYIAIFPYLFIASFPVVGIVIVTKWIFNDRRKKIKHVLTRHLKKS